MLRNRSSVRAVHAVATVRVYEAAEVPRRMSLCLREVEGGWGGFEPHEAETGGGRVRARVVPMYARARVRGGRGGHAKPSLLFAKRHARRFVTELCLQDENPRGQPINVHDGGRENGLGNSVRDDVPESDSDHRNDRPVQAPNVTLAHC